MKHIIVIKASCVADALEAVDLDLVQLEAAEKLDGEHYAITMNKE